MCTSWLVDDLISRIWTRSTGLIHQWYLPISAMICPRHAAMLKTDRASLSTVNLPGGDVRTRGMPPGRIAKSNHLVNSQRSASMRACEDDSRSCGFCARRLPGSIVQFWLLHEHDSRPFSASRVTRSELRRCRRGRCTIRLYGHVMEVDPRLNLKTACMFHKGSFVRHGKR